MSCCDIAGVTDLIEEASNRNNDLKQAAIILEDGLFRSDFTISNMHCAACLHKLESHFSKLCGVERARANLSLKRFSVTWYEGKTTPGKLEKEIKKLGFSPEAFDLEGVSDRQDAEGRQLLVALGVAGFAAMNIMLLSVSVWSGANQETAQLFHLISGLIAIPAVGISGRPFFLSAFKALKAGRLNMDVPISLAVLLALMLSVFESLTGGQEAYFDAAVTLLFFLLTGRYLDHLMRSKAHSAIEQLGRLTAKGASVLTADEVMIYKPLCEIEEGAIIRLKPGERVPLDGCLVSHDATFDRSLVTGESVPVRLHKDDEIEAGTLNLYDVVDLRVMHNEDQSFIAEIMRLMAAAEGSRSRYVRIADRMATIYAPAVHLLALATFIGWMVVTGGAWQASLYTAITVLIITCPCALGLAVPVVHVLAATRLFQAGIMMKDGSALERMAEIDAVMLDKTGTLTTGLTAMEITSADGSLRALAGVLASYSSHPKARAVAQYITRDLPLNGQLESVREVAGKGVEGIFNNKRCRFGHAAWVGELMLEKPVCQAVVACALEEGDSLCFEITEMIRADAEKTVNRLKQKGLPVAILSGDNVVSVEKVAGILGIDQIFSACRPEEKVNILQEAALSGQKLLMVGDGLNDAAALSSAHVSMAPASACDIGRLTADFVFTRQKLSAVLKTRDVARRSARLVRQNFALALLYNCIAVPLAIAGMVTPLVAALAMSLSSLVVIANSMRLNLDKSASHH